MLTEMDTRIVTGNGRTVTLYLAAASVAALRYLVDVASAPRGEHREYRCRDRRGSARGLLSSVRAAGRAGHLRQGCGGTAGIAGFTGNANVQIAVNTRRLVRSTSCNRGSPGVETFVDGLNPGAADGTADGDLLGVTLISATSGFTSCTFTP
jgi:hypothetical protein